MGQIVIAAYKPIPGKEHELEMLIKNHTPHLRRLGLATEMPNTLMRAKDGTVVEVFEWKSAEAIAAAHTHPEVLAMWEAYAKVCTYTPLVQLAECADLFSTFTPLA